MTVKELTNQLDTYPRKVQRAIEKHSKATGQDFPTGLNDPVPVAVIDQLSTGQTVKRIKASEPQPSLNGNKKKATPKTRAAKNVQAKDSLFKNSVVIIVNAAVLILVDAVSFGWIAYNVYPEFYLAAVPIFAVAGMSVGYAAFTSILSGKKWDSEAWIVGFMFFQIALHLCAMQAIGEYSFLFGKIVIALGLPMGSIGLALALKNMKDEK